uniref:Transcriptional coactivator p15 (PC4) C-terminal domain-containing protein n=1 Tax=Trichuris muris TaxID=70415 RepID=A0A5S6QLY8_TRIMR
MSDSSSSEESVKETTSTERSAKGEASKAKKGKVDEEKKETDEQKFEIGDKRFVSISEYKGRVLVDIREFYSTSDGELKPGRKGISLDVNQFRALVKCIPKLEEQLKNR